MQGVVVGLGRLGPPLADRTALARGDDVALRVRDVLGKEPVLFGLFPEQRHRTAVAGGRREPGVDEGPLVRLPRWLRGRRLGDRCQGARRGDTCLAVEAVHARGLKEEWMAN